MGVSIAVRRLGARWPEVVDRVRQEAKSIPAEGLTILGFGLAMLDVPPTAFDEVAKALARKGVVWIGKDRGVEKVFAKKPSGISRAMASPVRDALLSGIAPYMHEAGRAALDIQSLPMMSHAEPTARRAVAISRIVRKCNKALRDGMSLREIREAIALAFGSELGGTLYHSEPALAPSSKEEALSSRVAQRPHISIADLSIDDKVYRHVEARGRQGMSRTELLQTIKPHIKAVQLTDVLSSLEQGGMVVSVLMLAPNAFRKATRYFASSVGAPALDSVGRARDKP